MVFVEFVVEVLALLAEGIDAIIDRFRPPPPTQPRRRRARRTRRAKNSATRLVASPASQV
jgi:hypothetical protein